MRLAIFSDIHGNLVAFEAMLQDLATVGDIDMLWCLGDFAAFGTRPTECVARLRELQEHYGKEKFKVIGGNTDRYLVTGKRPETPAAKDADGLARRQQNFSDRDIRLNWTLQQLTWDDYEFMAKTIGREVQTRVDGYGIVIGYHAVPGDDEPINLRPDSPDEEAADALLDRQGRLAIGGHTHAVMDRMVGNWRVLNPGSVGFSFTQYGMAEWLLIDFVDGDAQLDFRSVPYDVEALIADAEAVGYPHPEFLQSFVQRAKKD